MHNLDEVLGELGLNIGKATRARQWPLPVSPKSYRTVTKKLITRRSPSTAPGSVSSDGEPGRHWCSSVAPWEDGCGVHACAREPGGQRGPPRSRPVGDTHARPHPDGRGKPSPASRGGNRTHAAIPRQRTGGAGVIGDLQAFTHLALIGALSTSTGRCRASCRHHERSSGGIWLFPRSGRGRMFVTFTIRRWQRRARHPRYHRSSHG